MVNINLANWRTSSQTEQKKVFLKTAAIGAGAALIIIVLIHLIYKERISTQLARNDYLQQNITDANTQISNLSSSEKTLSELQQEQQAIQQLENNHYIPVIIMGHLSQLMPNEIYLTKLERSDQDITLTGKALSNDQITSFLQNINKSDIFSNPLLNQIKSTSSDEGHVFKIQLKTQSNDSINDPTKNPTEGNTKGNAN